MTICIAHGGDLGDPSGGTTRISAFATGLADRGLDVTVIAPAPTGPLPSGFDAVRFHSVDVPTRSVVDHPVRGVAVIRRARTIAEREEAHLQVEHSTLGGVAALLGCRGFLLDMHDLAHRSPVYGELPFGRVVKNAIGRLEGYGLRAATDIVVVSEHMQELAANRWNLSPRRFTVVPNGYDPNVVEPHLDTSETVGRVVFLGTLHRKIDVDALVATARRPEVTELIVIGDGPRRDSLAREARRVTGLRLTGRLPDADAFSLVASASVAVNPQRASALQAASSPVKVYYYAALGTAMVLTDGPDVVREFGTAGAARTVPPGGDFAGAVADLVEDGPRRERLATRATELADGRTWSDRTARLASLYR